MTALFRVPEHLRLREGPMATSERMGNNGMFIVPAGGTVRLRVIASDGQGWEHVSVSLANRCPTWEEMCLVKELFWHDDACVVQYHPPKSDYVNCHDYCLHLWRPVGVALVRPPSIMVGAK